MAKLKLKRPRFAPKPVRFAPKPPTDQNRTQRHAWRAWYGTARWRALSLQVRKAARFTCARCGVISGAPYQTVADHIEPHRGDPVKFWDESNLHCLCKTCHDKDKQREEAEAARYGF